MRQTTLKVLMIMKTSYLKKLFIDLETFSSRDLSKTGVYKYAESLDFEILLLAYSFDGEEVKVVDLAKGEDVKTSEDPETPGLQSTGQEPIFEQLSG